MRQAKYYREVDLGSNITAIFTTRHGGVSGGPWAEFNLSYGGDDDSAAVTQNRKVVAEQVGAPLVGMRQVHGGQVAEVQSEESGPPPEADALVTTNSEIALTVLVADCVPVLLADPGSAVVAAAHAGRRGLIAGIIPATLEKMRRRGADLAKVQAAIGPAICGSCYEVPAAMAAQVAAVIPATESKTSWGTAGLDLPAGVKSQLRAAGVDKVHQLANCTYEDFDYYSYRRNSQTGRAAGVIRLKP